MARIAGTDWGTDYITVKVSGITASTAKYIEFYIDGTLDKYYTLSTTSKSHTYTGLRPDTSYELSAIVYDSSWNSLPFANNSTTERTLAESTPDWTLATGTFGANISSTASKSVSIDPYCLLRYSVSFATSGTATFYTTGSLDTIGYVTTSTGWNSTTGYPNNTSITDDDSGSGSNCKITTEVNAGTTYYFWVRCYDENKSGSLTSYCEPPASAWVLQTANLSTVSTSISRSLSIAKKTMYRYQMTFAKSGKVTFASSGSTDTHGYLSTTTAWDNSTGVPTSYIEFGDDEDGVNFSFSRSVTAGTTYYLWVRGYNDATSGSTTVLITPSPVEPWDWTASNGSATAAQTKAAYGAITSKGAVSNFSYLVWNDMVDKVLEIMDAAGVTWNTKFASAASTKMTSSNKTLTATRFNSLRHNIGLYSSTGIGDVAAGQLVYGAYFITLTSCMNDWLSTI